MKDLIAVQTAWKCEGSFESRQDCLLRVFVKGV
jgi:hypothetical protein